MKTLVIFGAGTSIPSGIPGFRGKGAGQFNFNYFDRYYIEGSTKKEKQKIIKYYKELINSFNSKKKNEYHDFFEKLNKEHDTFFISQNIDTLDLDLKPNILKLHGQIDKLRCFNNYKHNIKDKTLDDRCPKCNSFLIPDIVLYNEKYSNDKIMTINKIKKIDYDVLFVIGTSLEITYIANLVYNIKSKYKININPDFKLSDGFLNYDDFNDFNKKLGKDFFN